MKAAGLTLATISLVAEPTEKYAETLETIRLFRSAKYRRFFQQYCNLLGLQQAALVNTIEIALGVEFKDEDITGVLSRFNARPIWRDHALQHRLQRDLGRDYTAFANVIEDTKHLLEELHRRLEDVSVHVG